MPLRYDNLWKLIEKRGISKTEFRKLVGISTVSLAKLSKNEPVTLNIIEQICQVLKCDIAEVVSVVSKSENKKWGRIQEESFYLVNLYFLVENDADQEMKVRYLYGFGTAYDIEIEERRNWALTKEFEQKAIELWRVSHTVKGEILLAMINSIDQNLPFGEVLQNYGHDLKCNKSGMGKKIKEILLSETILPRNYIYRPLFFLTAEQECENIIAGAQPLHSFGNTPMLCEALVSQKKDELYYDANGCPDNMRMQFIYDFFKREGFAVKGFRDVSRIGDFEVFYPLNDLGGNELLEVETIRSTTDDGEVQLLGYKVTVHAEQLEGEYALEAIISGNMGPVVHKMFSFALQGKDITREIMLEENAGTIEVRLFDLNSDNRYQLMAWKKTSIIMEFHLRTNIISKRMSLVSQKRKNVAENYTIEQYSGREFKTASNKRRSCDRIYQEVYDDFYKVYGEDRAETHLFPAHDEGTEFVDWIREKINRKSKAEIWIFDPYIDEQVIPKLLSMIRNLGVTLHIVTSFNDKYSESIKQICQEASSMMGSMEIVMLKGNKGKFHDRIIVISEENGYPEVFSLSNSLDNMGGNYSSIAARLDRVSGIKVSEEYLGKYYDAEAEGAVEMLYKTTPNTSGRKKENIAVALDVEKLSHDAGTEGILQEAKKYLQLYEIQKNGEKKFLTVILKKDFRTCLEYIKDHYIYRYGCEELYSLPITIRQLLKTLLEKAYDKYMELLKTYSAEQLGMTALQIHNAMLEILIDNLRWASTEDGQNTAVQYLGSDMMEVVALGAAYLMNMDEMDLLCKELADRKDCLEECYRERIIELQIEDCSRHYRMRGNQTTGNMEEESALEEIRAFNDKLEDAKQTWVNLMDEDLSEEQLKYKFGNLAFRSVQDVCDLVLLLLDGKKITGEIAGNYLLECLFEKIKKECEKEEGVWRWQDFEDAAVYIMTIEQCSGTEGRKKILKNYAAWEKKLVRVLQDVFLEKKNYRRWKTCIDSLLWCMTMRSFCKKNWSDYDVIIEDTNLLSREMEINGIIRKSQYKLEKYSEAYQIYDKNS